MRPSSSSSDGLLSAVLARGEVAATVDDEGLLRALLEVEAALARACAAVGLVPEEAAAAITGACADAAAYDIAALGRAAAAGGNPVIPLVRAIEARAGTGAAQVHFGATSQDVMDTALMLVARRALGVLAVDLDAVVSAAARLAQQHRDTVVAGRTLLQQAVPTTFGLKAAGWALAVRQARVRLDQVQLPVQLGGAAGTLAAYAGEGQAVVAALAGELGLAVPVLPWHTARLPIADLAGALGATAGVVGKVALDVVLLAQTEVAEVAEGSAGSGGSSAMPHKHNPVAAVQARAAARRAPGLVSTLLSCMEQEHERAAGAWHAEWVPLGELLVAAGSAASWLRECLEQLTVDAPRMLRNLASGDLASAPVADALTPALGRSRAHDVVAEKVSAGGDLRTALLADPEVAAVLSDEQLDRLLDPSTQVGEAGALVDAALAALGGRA